MINTSDSDSDFYSLDLFLYNNKGYDFIYLDMMSEYDVYSLFFVW